MIPQYSFTWNSFKNNISNGFARLQQNGEFVDMSIVVEGHIVKVHQNIMALASPYFKEILQSVPSQHPIVFLCNITHDIFAYILEYVYTGEVKVPSQKINLFIEATKVLHIFGIKNVIPPKHPSFQFKQDELRSEPNIRLSDSQTIQANNNTSHSDTIDTSSDKKDGDNNIILPGVSQSSSHIPRSWDENQLLKTISITPATNTEINNEIFNLETDLTGSAEINEMDYSNNTKDDNLETMLSNEPFDVLVDNSNSVQEMRSINDNLNMNSNTDSNICKSNESGKDLNMTISTNCDSKGPRYSFNVSVRNPIDRPSPQYTMSNRGSLQLIFNRYLYYVHHTSHGGSKRRWRCVDYRRKHCPAMIDTDGENIIFRRFTHIHNYHDDKILKKLKRNIVYTTISNILHSEKHKLTKTRQRHSDESD